MHSRVTPSFQTFSAFALLVTWLGVVGLEISHQMGHLLAGCSHHEHHGVPARHHAECKSWEGPHEDTQLSTHQHVCDMCEWQWLPQGEIPDTPCSNVGREWKVPIQIGETAPVCLASPCTEAHGRRGPPARG